MTRPRVAFLAGTLGRGGAEKQLVYMVRALVESGADVRVCCLTRGEHHESTLADLGAPPIYIGSNPNPAARVVRLVAALRRFRPHVIQSAHFYTNLHVALAARALGATSIGGVRSDLRLELEDNRLWGRWLLRAPSQIVANSFAARDHARASGLTRDIRVLPNVIDLEDFDRRRAPACDASTRSPRPLVLSVGRLVPVKRHDQFLEALARARRTVPTLRGAIVGAGPERPTLDRQAARLGLSAPDLEFLGARDDVPSLLGDATMFALTSDHEGFPNAILEAMAAGLPVVTTPAGDAGIVVRDGETGFVTPSDDTDAMADRMVRLATSADLCRDLGHAARRRVESCYNSANLSRDLLELYRDAVSRRVDTRAPEAQASPMQVAG